MSGTKYTVDRASLKLDGAVLSATLTNAAAVPPATFELKLISYGGTLRVHVDESAPNGRYQVPEILEPDVDARRSPWQDTTTGPAHWIGASATTHVRLAYSPFRLEVYAAETAAFMLNGRDMFHVEHRRTKQVG